MRRLFGLNTLLATVLVVLLPSVASANLVIFAGTVASGSTEVNPFVVSVAGTFDFASASDFYGRLKSSDGGLDTGYINSFSRNLGLGSYTLSITNICCSVFQTNGYIAKIYSDSGVAAKVPEPASLILLGTGLLGLGLLRRRRALSA